MSDTTSSTPAGIDPATGRPSLATQLGRHLAEERERQGVSRRKFADEHGVTNVTLLQYEHGKVNPTLAKVQELAAMYGLEVVLTVRRRRR